MLSLRFVRLGGTFFKNLLNCYRFFSTMSIDDRFNQEDESWIDKADSALLQFNKKVASRLKKVSSLSKSELGSIAYVGSATAFGVCAFYEGHALGLLPALYALKLGTDEEYRSINTLATQMSLELQGLHGKLTKYVDVFCYSVGLLNVFSGIGWIASGALSGDNECYLHSFNELAFGFGALGFAKGEYFCRS